MPSVRVKWRLSPFEPTEITINDVLGDVKRLKGDAPCEAQAELHADRKYVVETKGGVYVLCRRCCGALGLTTH